MTATDTSDGLTERAERAVARRAAGEVAPGPGVTVGSAAVVEGATVVEGAAIAGGAADSRVAGARVALLPPHGSQRRYARVHAGDGATAILMLLPDADAAPDEVGGASGGAVADEPFLTVQRWLLGAGVRVPQVLAVDERERVIWLEDVGDTDLDRAQGDALAEGGERVGLYRSALGLLAAFQGAGSAAPPLVTGRRFDADLLRWELEHYVEWRLVADLGLTLTTAARAALDAGFARLVERIVALPQVPVHRDFQSHNIMRAPSGELVLLDFQDALMGPIPYDAVALLRDSYVVLRPAERDELIARWAATAAATPAAGGLDAEALTLAFHLTTAQRKLKDSGRFVFFDRVRGNAAFLRYIPDSLSYVAHALVRCSSDRALAELGACLSELDPLVSA